MRLKEDLKDKIWKIQDGNVRLFIADLLEYLEELEGKLGITTEPVNENKPSDVKCPDCGGKMVSRTGQYGRFWGCADYPKCKGTRDSMGRSKSERENHKRKDDHEDIGPDSRNSQFGNKRWDVPS